jgi:hypothetical protein
MLPFRDIANASAELLDELRVAILGQPCAPEDDTLDDLVRHALNTTDGHEADVHGVWNRLSGRVLGPFGRLAIEGPAGYSTTVIAASGMVGTAPGGGRGNGTAGETVNVHSRAFGQGPESMAVTR